MAETSDSREVWVLERDGFPALVDEDEFDCVSPHRFKHTGFRGGKRVDTESTRYIPAPTWRPIAELPKEWRDGRWILAKDVDESPEPFAAQYVRDGTMGDEESDSLGWWEGWQTNGEFEVSVTHYLDLAIQEVPHA